LFGFDLHDNDTSNRTGAKLLFDFDEWQYNMNQCDWVNTKTGELLSGYEITPELKGILNNNFNLHLK